MTDDLKKKKKKNAVNGGAEVFQMCVFLLLIFMRSKLRKGGTYWSPGILVPRSKHDVTH